MGDPSQPLGKATATQVDAVFGYQEFWPIAYAQFQRQFEGLKDLMRLGNDMVKAADEKAAEPIEKLVCDLTRMTLSGACEVIVLCGNGCGPGAMKIVRGMYESQWIAKYLRRHPEEVENYVEFSKVSLWRKLRWSQKNTPAKASGIPQAVIKQIEDEYELVKMRFGDRRGGVRWQWSEKSIGQIAEDIGHKLEYELPYAISCSIHHGNFEGLLAHFVSAPGEMGFEPPPSTQWIAKALLSAHANVWYVLDTLNDSCVLGFDAQLEAAQPTLSSLAKP